MKAKKRQSKSKESVTPSVSSELIAALQQVATKHKVTLFGKLTIYADKGVMLMLDDLFINGNADETEHTLWTSKQ